MQRINWFIGVILMAILLAACGGVAPPLDPVRTISGTVQNWDEGTATVQPVTTDEEDNITGRLDTTGTINPNGDFSLTLPATVEGNLLESTTFCEGEFTGTVTPPNWQEMFANLFVFQDDEATGFLLLTNSEDVFFEPQVGDMAVFRLYVDRAVSIQGECVDEEGATDFDVTLREGWNLVVFEVTEGGEDTPFRGSARSAAAEPAGLVWHYIDFAAFEGMTSTSLLR